jgi:hypothetical protein
VVSRLGPDARAALEWSLEDLLVGEGSEAARFPKFLALGEARLPVHYRFEPGAPDDGVTLGCRCTCWARSIRRACPGWCPGSSRTRRRR